MIAPLIAPMFAAVGDSLIYLLFGGGLGGAILIFIVPKMVGKQINPLSSPETPLAKSY